jgi:hypothetical protein
VTLAKSQPAPFAPSQLSQLFLLQHFWLLIFAQNVVESERESALSHLPPCRCSAAACHIAALQATSLPCRPHWLSCRPHRCSASHIAVGLHATSLLWRPHHSSAGHIAAGLEATSLLCRPHRCSAGHTTALQATSLQVWRPHRCSAGHIAALQATLAVLQATSPLCKPHRCSGGHTTALQATSPLCGPDCCAAARAAVSML